MTLVLTMTIIPVISLAYADKAEIYGEHCYHYDDSDSLYAAKEISYVMALRNAIETHQIFVPLTCILKDFQLRKDLLETIASGYVEDIKIIKREVIDRTVCMTLMGYINPNAVRKILTRKIEKVREKILRVWSVRNSSNLNPNVVYLQRQKPLRSRDSAPSACCARLGQDFTYGEVRLDLSEPARNHIWRALARFSSTQVYNVRVNIHPISVLTSFRSKQHKIFLIFPVTPWPIAVNMKEGHEVRLRAAGWIS